MKPIQWLEADELGHHEIDREHRQLIDALNEAIRAFNDRRNEHCSQAIESAVEVTRRHFAHEEAILLDSGYRGNDYQSHAAYHERLLREAEKIAALCKTNNRRDFLEARLAELVYFVVYEIRNCDKELKRHFSGAQLTADL